MNISLKKRILCFLLSILIIFCSIIYQYQEVQAIAPAMVLAGWAIPEAVQIVGALLCAAGITFIADTAVDRLSRWFIADVAPGVRDALYDAIVNAQNGVVSIADSVWQAAVDWVQQNVRVGNQTMTKNYFDGEVKIGTSIYNLPLNYDIANTTETTPEETIKPVCVGQSFQIGSDIYTFELLDYDGQYYKYVVERCNGSVVSGSPTKIVDIWYPIYIYLEAYQLLDKVLVRPRMKYVPMGFDRYYHDDATFPSIGELVGSIPSLGEIAVTGQDVIGLDTWDIAQDGERKIKIVDSVSDIVGITYQDVIDMIPDTTVDPPSGTGEWDYPNWRVPADILKNKFPFSIPWDLKGAVEALVATPEAPKWIISFPSSVFIGGGQIVIDFGQFEVWAKVIRWGILIIFNVFLILATRKIIGA